MENEPAGSVYCALATAAHTYAFHFQINHAQRNEVRQQVVEAMRDEVIRYLKENGVRK